MQFDYMTHFDDIYRDIHVGILDILYTMALILYKQRVLSW